MIQTIIQMILEEKEEKVLPMFLILIFPPVTQYEFGVQNGIKKMKIQKYGQIV